MLGHLVLGALLWGVWQLRPGDPAPKGAMLGSFVVIELPPATEASAPPQREPDAERPAERLQPTPVAVTENPAPRPQSTPEPRPQPVEPAPAEVHAATEESPAAAVAAAPGQMSEADAERYALLRGVRSNWLEPPGPRRQFRCRVTIVFAEGRVTDVEVDETCGDAQLHDSIVRATWKSATLLGRHSQPQPLSFEFSP